MNDITNKKVSILGVIPARGGSRRIPRKNIKEIAGRPLITWTIEAAGKSRLLDRCVVSTEDKEISEVAMKCGAEVLSRPAELAINEITNFRVLQHAIKQIPCDIVLLLQATSPIRSQGLIDECIKEFIDNKYNSLATGFICKYIEYGKNDFQEKKDSGFFYDDGNVYVMKADCLREGRFYSENMGRKIISRWENVEIDDDFDFWLAEQILLKQIKDGLK